MLVFVVNKWRKHGKNIEPKSDSPRRCSDKLQNEDTHKRNYYCELKPITVASIASLDNGLSMERRVQVLARR